MKKIVLVLLIAIATCSCNSAKPTNILYTYWDVDNEQMTESEFMESRATNEYLDIQIDSLNQKKLIERTQTGTIKNIEVYQSLVSNKALEDINFSEPLVIIYHPGKDACNSSGSPTKRSLRSWHHQLRTGAEKLHANAPIYLYKENTGLEKYWKVVDWYKDPGGLTEKLFFRHHYPCSSFVVIAPDGAYISYFGEFPQKFVFLAIDLISSL